MDFMNGISNSTQAWLVFVSSLCIAIGALSIPTGVSVYVTVVFEIIGVLGLTLKEFLGSAPTSSTSTSSSTNSTNNANSTGSPTAKTQVTEPPTPPPGFSIASAKAAGYQVYYTSTGTYFLKRGNNFYNVYGDPISATSGTEV